MFRQGVNRLALVPLNGSVDQQRGMATLKDISIRLKSVKNIQKITKSMKMVAAAKYAKAERDLKGARSYGEGAQAFFNNIGGSEQAESAAKESKKRLLVLMTSDRGLCGAVHSSIAKVCGFRYMESSSIVVNLVLSLQLTNKFLGSQEHS